MELYQINGDYPDRHSLVAFVLADNQREAIAMAEGLNKASIVKRIHVYAVNEGRCVYFNEL